MSAVVPTLWQSSEMVLFGKGGSGDGLAREMDTKTLAQAKNLTQCQTSQ